MKHTLEIVLGPDEVFNIWFFRWSNGDWQPVYDDADPKMHKVRHVENNGTCPVKVTVELEVPENQMINLTDAIENESPPFPKRVIN
jgi:hypothetical protein